MPEAAHTFERYPDSSVSNKSESWAIVKLKNSASGVPSAIIIEGRVKCISCQAASETLLCDACRSAINIVRAADNRDTLKQLIEFANRPGILNILENLTYEAVGEMMMQRIDDARNRD